MHKLPGIENGVYILVYLIFLIYGAYMIYLKRDVIASRNPYHFAEGWRFIGSPRDDTSTEWNNFKGFLQRNFIWYFIHIISTEICRFCKVQAISFIHCLIGTSFIIFTYRWPSIFLIFSQIFSFYAISKMENTKLIWCLELFWLSLLNILNKRTNIFENVNYEEYFELVMIIAWGFLRNLSFSLDKLNAKRKEDWNKWKKYYDIFHHLGYTLYFPTLIFGPVMIYDRYIRNEINEDFCETNIDRRENEIPYRIEELLRNLLRIFIWLMLNDFILHFLYINYLETDLQAVKELNVWSFYAFGYFMGQIFHINYVVTYGLAIFISKFDCLDPPNIPKCIGRINFYSDMWKYFDQGLYEFLFKYIYSNLCTRNSSIYWKTLASIITFAFIYVWHGMFDGVLIWTVLNFLCLCVEKSFQKFTKSTNYRRITGGYLSLSNQIRLYGFLGSQIFIPSAIANFYFFSNVDIGNYFILNTYCGGVLNYISLSFCSYCIFQCSEFTWLAFDKRSHFIL